MDGQRVPDRLPIGQLLTNLLRLFRIELASRNDGSPAVAGIRPAHLPVFAAIKAGGSRLTALAAGSGLSLSSAAELVDDLQALGYLERRPDPDDRRAKLVSLTERGWTAMRIARATIADIEADWTAALGDRRFASMAADLQALLDALDPAVRQDYSAPPDPPEG